MIPKPIGACIVARRKLPYRETDWRDGAKIPKNWNTAIFPAYHQVGNLAVTNTRDYHGEKVGRWMITDVETGFRIGSGFNRFEQAQGAANILHASGLDWKSVDPAHRKEEDRPQIVAFLRTVFSAVEKLWECGFEDGMEAAE
jgi:hypothetical protein